MEKSDEHADELTAVKSVSTGGFHSTEMRGFVPDKHSRIDEPKEDVTGCVHYKRRAKFVVSY